MKLKWIIGLVVLVILCLRIWHVAHTDYNLRKYGVYYKMSTGASESLVIVQFYRKKGEKIEQGPEIMGSNLGVYYKDLNGDGVREIILEGIPGHRTILRLNLTDSSRPDFEVVGKPMHSIDYAPLGLYIH